jgi:hypothetical protein
MFRWKGQGEVRQGKTFYTHTRRRWQIIPTKLPGVIGQAMNATTPFEAWNGLIAIEILGNILLYTNQYILNTQHN